jgi:hypothetical protein
MLRKVICAQIYVRLLPWVDSPLSIEEPTTGADGDGDETNTNDADNYGKPQERVFE